MKRATRIGVVAAALVLAGTAFVEHALHDSRRQRLDSARNEAARLDDAVRQARARLEVINGELESAVQPARPAETDGSPTRVWAGRVRILQQLLAELPAHRLPEQRLLEALDWIEVVRDAELDTPARIRDALAAARAAGRQKLVTFLQEALRRFTDESGGRLPADIRELARFLKPPADAEMLARYHLTRSGQLSATDEILIVENADSDMVLSVGLTNWSMSSGSKPLTAPNEDEIAALVRAARAMGTTVAGEVGDAAGQYVESIRVLAEAFGTQFESAFGDTFKADMKQAIQRFAAEHPGEQPTNFGQIAAYYANLDKVTTLLRPLLAELEYMQDHQGRLPADPAHLRVYLDRPFDPQRAFRSFKLELSADGEHGSMSFSFGPK